MNIGGFQKMTVLDYPGRVACTLFTHGCNLRCPFCHNASLVTAPSQAWDAAQILAYLEKRRGVLDGICVSGGEPTLTPDLEDLLRSILGPHMGNLDALVLGCTHYPFAAKAISRILGDHVVLLDGGDGTARETLRRLREANLLSPNANGKVTLESSAESPQMVSLAEELLHREW